MRKRRIGSSGSQLTRLLALPTSRAERMNLSMRGRRCVCLRTCGTPRTRQVRAKDRQLKRLQRRSSPDKDMVRRAVPKPAQTHASELDSSYHEQHGKRTMHVSHLEDNGIGGSAPEEEDGERGSPPGAHEHVEWLDMIQNLTSAVRQGQKRKVHDIVSKTLRSSKKDVKEFIDVMDSISPSIRQTNLREIAEMIHIFGRSIMVFSASLSNAMDCEGVQFFQNDQKTNEIRALIPKPTDKLFVVNQFLAEDVCVVTRCIEKQVDVLA
ncbi:hypothetical protein GUITHDRAFT_102406 [Guillardia theta CCMP2712]|uniref:Uncharacterized protein n=1 Tax=Guillardia theta (strain CCMP2712) TaxID=905079 RepID=L1JTS2_GUITC|nr:hypothetical protein GUITHDRAFT_102406 [Guillardia theta CCMP2712]EKX51797.1 hypothetical protein GUITHDRAFT_102406 [Guillardia theta CCMP2712]|eukprot:XP_005838777.1 hypothetical protein GUITHDRAFT_102406 [Guillardia theta CCMP2712]